MRALILEDDRDRRVAMIAQLAERFPFLRVAFFDASNKMIDFMMKSDHLQDVVMISLDHDLNLIPSPQGDWIDPGTGLDVAQWLAKRSKPLCPIVVHTTNIPAGTKMMRLLAKSHWASHRVIPCDDLKWIETDWFRVVRNAIVGFAPRHRLTPDLHEESKVGHIRSLLNDQYKSGQDFCRAAMTQIVDAYVRDLRKMLGEACAELIALDGTISTPLETEGPVLRWWRQVGFVGLGVLHDVAQQGPTTVEALRGVNQNDIQRLLECGVRQIQVEILEIADMQALLIVSTSGQLAEASVQTAITELKHAIEIVLFIGLHWPSRKRSKPPQGKQ